MKLSINFKENNMSYEYIKELEGLQCISCEKEIKNLPIAHELYSPANSASKFNFVYVLIVVKGCIFKVLNQKKSM